MGTTVKVIRRIARLTPRNNIVVLNCKNYLVDAQRVTFSNFIATNDSKYIEIKIICKLEKKCQK